LLAALLIFASDSDGLPPSALGELASAARASAIEDELMELAPTDSPFFGRFTFDHATLEMAPSAGFILSSSNCLGDWVRAFGRVRRSHDRVELIPIDPTHFPISTIVLPDYSHGSMRLRRSHSLGFEYWLGF